MHTSATYLRPPEGPGTLPELKDHKKALLSENTTQSAVVEQAVDQMHEKKVADSHL